MGEQTTAIRERPIIMSGDSVRAILAGAKTQTRRVVKPQPPSWIRTFGYSAFTPVGHISGRGIFEPDGPAEKFYRCPHGRVGDRLWGRETFSTSGLTRYHRSGNPDDHGGPNDPCCAYAATATYRCGKRVPDAAMATGAHKWKSPLFMPRWASRLTLELTEVRVERVQKITHADALAEGCAGRDWVQERPFPPETINEAGELPRHEYKRTWDALNAARGFPWSSNCWTWVLRFRVVPQPEVPR